jgi:thioredoxin reductase
MGVYDALPSIDGLREVWGRTAFVCPYCDAWEVRGKRIAVVAKGAKAVELAQELHQWSSDIVICSQGANSLPAEYQRWVERTGSTHLAQPVRRIVSNDSQVTAVEFSDGTQEHCDAVFLNASLRPRYPLVEQLGCRLREDGEIDIDEHGRTSVAGIYAAGDAVTTVHQVVLAAASGVCAAIAMNEDCLQDDVRRAIR